MSYVDLHMHSLFSDDGEFSVEQLVTMCDEAGVKVMAIADHNCARANKEAKVLAEQKGMNYLSAIEMDCTYKGVNLHLLGYGIDAESDDFKQVEHAVDVQCKTASYQMLDATRKLGFDVEAKDLETLSEPMFFKYHWTGEMFAEVLLHDERYKDHPMLMPYREGNERSDNPYVNFYWDYYSQGKPCYVAMNYPTLEEAIAIIHKNHGKAVLAHPGVNLGIDHPYLSEILALVDGIEAFSSYHTADKMAYFYDQAMQHQRFVTFGSDFHGKTKPSIHLGGHGCTLSEDEVQRNIDLLCK